MKKVLIPIIAVNGLVSCSGSINDTAVGMGLLAGGVAHEASGDGDKIVNGAAAAVGGFALTKWNGKRKAAAQKETLRKVYNSGRAQVVKDQFFRHNYNNQLQQPHLEEVEVPIDSYVTQDGVVLDPHTKVITIAQ